MPKFESGTLVRLKSGGPTMTIRSDQGLGIECTWFDSDNHVFTRLFPYDNVEVVDATNT